MLRFQKYYGSQSLVGFCSLENNISDDETSMREIVKRFFNNEPIPEDLMEKNYEYGSEDTKLSDGNSFDPLTREVLGPDGSVIKVDLSAPDILSTIPITPNLDLVEECLGESECGEDISEMYYNATERARAMVRGYQAEMKSKNDEKLKAAVELAKSKGIISEDKVSVLSPSAPLIDSSNS